MTQSETTPRPKERPWLGFGAALKTWLSYVEIPNANLARDLEVSETTVSDWLAGRKRPSPLYLLQILDKVRSKNERVGIHRDTILDALVNLDYGWEDIRNLAKDILEKKDETIFNGWWAQNRPPTPLCVFPVQDISINYTAFEETESIARALISWRGYRERQCRALVLGGLTGMGKTETAIAVANDVRVRNVYREGVLWIKSDLVNGPDLLERLCAAVDVKPDPGEDLQDAWRNWIADPERRVLLVLDDVKTGGPIGALLQGAGPLVSLLATTQNGKTILDACYELFPRDQVIWKTLRGFSPDTARTFIEKRTDRLLSDEEWETMRRIGKKSGWHPQSLHSTTSGDVTTWRGVVDAVERGGIPFPKVRADVIAQIEMLDGRLQLAIASLLKWMLFPTCFGALYAGAVLGGKPPEVAKLLLTDLEISGLIESLPAASSIGFVDQVWRITPIVQLALDNNANLKWHKKLWLTLGLCKYNLYISQHEMDMMRPPWQFGFWATLWWCANLGREIVCTLRFNSRFKAGVQLSTQDYESCITGAESLWRQKLQNQGADIPMEYAVLRIAHAQLQSLIGLIGIIACSVIFGLVSNTLMPQILDSLGSAGGMAVSWLAWFLPLLINLVFLVIIQYRIAVPNLWLMIQIGVQYKGLEWIMRKAHSWGMPEAEQTG